MVNQRTTKTMKNTENGSDELQQKITKIKKKWNS